MKPDQAGLEHLELGPAFQIHQSAQSLRVGHVQIIAGDQAQGSAAIEQFLKVRPQQPHAAFHDEGDGDIDPISLVDMGGQMADQGILATGDQRAGVRR